MWYKKVSDELGSADIVDLLLFFRKHEVNRESIVQFLVVVKK